MRLVEDVIEQFYLAVANNNGNFISAIHIPLSDVFYVREALHQASGIRYTLDYVEWAMLKENMIEPRHCYKPEEKITWSEYPLEKLVK